MGLEPRGGWGGIAAYREIAADAKFLEEAEGRGGAGAARIQQLRHFVAELEGSGLEAQVAARRNAQDEAEVDVNQVAVRVYHDVSVVPILGLQQEAGHRVPVVPPRHPQAPL